MNEEGKLSQEELKEWHKNLDEIDVMGCGTDCVMTATPVVCGNSPAFPPLKEGEIDVTHMNPSDIVKNITKQTLGLCKRRHLVSFVPVGVVYRRFGMRFRIQAVEATTRLFDTEKEVLDALNADKRMLVCQVLRNTVSGKYALRHFGTLGWLDWWATRLLLKVWRAT